MARREKPTQLPADRPEFPKPLVRLKADATGPGGYGCEVRLAADAEAESGSVAEGFVASTNLAGVLAGFQEYPKWVYHADGRRQVVYTEDEASKLDGFEPTPPVDPEAEAKGEVKGVPPPVAHAGALDSRSRPPVPVDRG